MNNDDTKDAIGKISKLKLIKAGHIQPYGLSKQLKMKLITYTKISMTALKRHVLKNQPTGSVQEKPLELKAGGIPLLKMQEKSQ